MGERLRMTRMELDENRTRFAENFGVLNNRWRMWEDGAYAADEWVMAEMCNRYCLTMDWLYRGHVETLPSGLQAKLCRRHPELLDEMLQRGRALKPSWAAASPPEPDQSHLTTGALPDEPARGRRRKRRRAPEGNDVS